MKNITVKIRRSKDVGYYLQVVFEISKAKFYIGDFGKTEDRFDYAVYFDNKAQATEYAENYKFNIVNPYKGKRHYSIFDRDTYNVMATGRNSDSYEDAIAEIFEYIYDSWDDEDKRPIGEYAFDEKEETVNNCEFEVFVHCKKIKFDTIDSTIPSII
jgi:hypothetical protein